MEQRVGRHHSTSTRDPLGQCEGKRRGKGEGVEEWGEEGVRKLENSGEHGLR